MDRDLRGDYDNWLISLESDNFASFIKIWFAYLASIHELVLKNAKKEAREELLAVHGDARYLNIYRDSHLQKLLISDTTRFGIIECYKVSKEHIKNTYPEYYHVTYFKKITDLQPHNKEVIEVGKDTYSLDVSVSKSNLHIGVLIGGNSPVKAKIKKRYVDITIPLIPNKDSIESIDDDNAFYQSVLDNIKSVFQKQIVPREGTKDYLRVVSKIQILFTIIINEYLKKEDIHAKIYKDKISENATDKDIKEWFHEFVYSLRNVLFHRIVDPFDSHWTRIVKLSYQALYDIVLLNIKELKKMDE